MKKFSEDNNLMILNENIKIDTSHIDDLNSRIEKEIQTNSDKSADLKNLEEKIKLKRQEVDSEQQDLKALEEKLGRSQQKREDQELEEEELENSKNHLKDLLATTSKTRNKLKISLDNNENQKSLIEEENKTLRKDIEGLKGEKQKIVDLVESEKKREEDSRHMVEDNQEKFDHLTEDIRNIRKKHDELVQDLEQLNDQAKESSLQLLETKDDLNQLTKEKQHKQEVKAQKDNNLDFIKKMISSLQNDQSAIEADKREQEDKLSTLNYQLKKLGTEQQMHKADILNKMEEYKL